MVLQTLRSNGKHVFLLPGRQGLEALEAFFLLEERECGLSLRQGRRRRWPAQGTPGKGDSRGRVLPLTPQQQEALGLARAGLLEWEGLGYYLHPTSQGGTLDLEGFGLVVRQWDYH